MGSCGYWLGWAGWLQSHLWGREPRCAGCVHTRIAGGGSCGGEAAGSEDKNCSQEPHSLCTSPHPHCGDHRLQCPVWVGSYSCHSPRAEMPGDSTLPLPLGMQPLISGGACRYPWMRSCQRMSLGHRAHTPLLMLQCLQGKSGGGGGRRRLGEVVE